MTSLRLLPSAAILLALTACTVGPEYRRPELSLPANYIDAPREPASPSSPQDMASWWRTFGDDGLTRSVERALAQNLDLAAARARILQSRAAAKAAGAALLPHAELQTTASDTDLSLLSPFGAVGNQVPGFKRSFGLVDFGASASWEIDLFGGLRRGREAARAELQASLSDFRAVQVSVAAETADAYLQLRAAQARLAVARRQEVLEERLVALLLERSGEGLSSERELAQARALLEGVRATLPPLEAAQAAQSARLDVLMGAPAGTYVRETASPVELPQVPTLDRVGGPADLLRQRPDVMAAERRVAAANARIGVAISDYYPKVSISGLLGVESLDTSRIFVGSALAHQVSGGLRWRLFDFGRVDAEVASARGRDAEALAEYRQTVYRATAEVETALVELKRSDEQAATLRRQIFQLTRARSEAEEAYESGVISLIEVIDADRDLLTASDSLAVARAATLRAAVAAYRAAGGGWTA